MRFDCPTIKLGRFWIIASGMIHHRQIAFGLRDVGMRRRQNFLANRECTEMRFLSLGVTLLVRVKNSEVIQNRSDIGVLRPELFFVNLKRVQIIRFGRFLPT